MLCDESAEIVLTVNDGLIENLLNCRQCEKSIEISECTGLDHASFVTGILVFLTSNDNQCGDGLHAPAYITVLCRHINRTLDDPTFLNNFQNNSLD